MAASGGIWKSGSFVGANSPQIMTFEQFAAGKNAGRFAVDVATNRLPGASAKQRKRQLKANTQAQIENTQRRNAARREYDQRVKTGEIRPPTRIEKLIQTAQGNPDNQSVQAARRVLKKQGISWR